MSLLVELWFVPMLMEVIDKSSTCANVYVIELSDISVASKE
jgi:hypothetical protein